RDRRRIVGLRAGLERHELAEERAVAARLVEAPRRSRSAETHGACAQGLEELGPQELLEVASVDPLGQGAGEREAGVGVEELAARMLRGPREQLAQEQAALLARRALASPEPRPQP